MSNLNRADTTLLIHVNNFFQKKENIDRILPIINRTSSISLRLLDYFCVNYSRCCQTSYPIDGKPFDVYNSYKTQLKHHSKKQFDPFRRNTRYTMRYDDNVQFDTTLAQLCFFKWCIQNDVLNYIENNLTLINEDMKKNMTNKNKSSKKKNNILETNENISLESTVKKISSKRKSSINMTATRVPTPPGTTSVIITFN